VSPKNDDPIVWSDLENLVLSATLSQMVIRIIRKCFLTYSPVIAVILSLGVWYFTGLSDSITSIKESQINMIKTQVRQTTEIRAITRSLDKIGK